MLTALTIKNFTLVEQLEIDFSSGMTAITGETGAGKSLVLGALGMALGDRADTDRIRRGAERMEVSALFDVNRIKPAGEWLSAQDFDYVDGECLLRRIITREGRSRGSINGQPATMSQLRELGEMLIDIHSQHEHQSLLRKDTHRQLLDNYASANSLANEVRQHYHAWRQLSQRLEQLEDQSDELIARRDLLSFQVEELDQLGLAEQELDSLEQQQRLLANAESILQDSQAVLSICSEAEDFNIQTSLGHAVQLLQGMPQKPPALIEAEKLLTSASIETEEACREIQQHLDSFELDPEKLQQVEDRLGSAFQLARKHRIPPEELAVRHQQLREELSQLSDGSTDIDALREQLDGLARTYQLAAAELSAQRQQAATAMAEAINDHLESLAMTGAQLIPQLTPLAEGELSSNGQENIEFLIITNPGEPPRPLAKIASGGELSRISLAIQVIAAHNSATPTLVFDEVDVGIGGATADVVGRLLRQLGNQGQVICVTHQPQVAACTHQHLLVSKTTQTDSAESDINPLGDDQRVAEIARMLSSRKVTDKTLEHAREMLELGSAPFSLQAATP